MAECLDQLDLASYSLTRVAGFSDRGLPSIDALDGWLQEGDLEWRKGTRDREKLEGACTASDNAHSYALASLLECSGEFLDRNVNGGWRFKLSGSPTTLMRWRLPLGTIHAAAAASAEQTRVGPAPITEADQNFDQALMRDGAVDGHVHLGACLPFDGLFHLITAQIALSDAQFKGALAAGSGLILDDTDGAVFRAGSVLAVGAILARVLDAFLASGADELDAFLDPMGEQPGTEGLRRFREALRAGETWAFLHEADASRADQGLRLELGHRYIAWAGPGAVDDDPYKVSAERKMALLRKILAGKGGRSLALCVEDLLRCEALVHASLTQGNHAGLSEFIAISQRLGRVRDPLPDQTTAVVGHGLPHLASGMRLRGVELRAAEQFANHDSADSLARSLDAKLAGYQDALLRIGDERRQPTATWPICLIRDPSMVADPDRPEATAQYRLRFDLQVMHKLVHHTADLLIDYPEARRLVPGFDVAGDENAVPSWCFALLFREFNKRLQHDEPLEGEPGRLSFRIHAGEDFDSPLQGLRRIDEAVRHVVPSGFRVRIGHGLALSHAASPFSPAALKRQPWDEAFDDLVWAWWLLDQSPAAGTPELVERLTRAIVEAGKRHYGIEEATPADYVEAYRKRFKEEDLNAVGLTGPSVNQRPLQPGGRSNRELMRTLTLPPQPRIADRLLLVYLTRAQLRAPCGAPLLDAVWLRQAIDATRPLVRGLVRSENVIVEACPTSNLVIAGIDEYIRHPIHEWLADGIQVTINTDDPGLLSVTLLDEYVNVWRSSPDPQHRTELLTAVQARSLDMIDGFQTAKETAEVVASVREQFAKAKKGPRSIDG